MGNISILTDSLQLTEKSAQDLLAGCRKNRQAVLFTHMEAKNIAEKRIQ